MASFLSTSLRTATRFNPSITSRAIRPLSASLITTQRSTFSTAPIRNMAAPIQGISSGPKNVELNVSPHKPSHTHNYPFSPTNAHTQADLVPKLPSHCALLFAQKKGKNLSFETIAKALGRDEVAVAALFYGQAMASEEDVAVLSKLLDIPHAALLASDITNIPDRGNTLQLPPREPLIYRLFEIIQNYGYAYKAVLNEKFGDGIMSAITFSTHVEKETDEKGEWVKITLRGKWYVFHFHSSLVCVFTNT